MHLDDSQLADITQGRGSHEDSRHAQSCHTCQEAVGFWKQSLSGLRSMAAESLDDAELHRLRVTFRNHRPRLRGARFWSALVVGDVSTPLVAGVRGGDAGIHQFIAGPFDLTLQIADAGRHGWTLHGQIASRQDDETCTGEMVISDDSGQGVTTGVDEHGEFHCTGIAPGSYTVTLWIGDDRVDVEKLEIGSHGA